MKNISLRKKLLAFIILPVLICTVVIIVLSSIKIHNQGVTDLIDKSNTILGINILEYTHNHVNGNDISELDTESSIKGVTSDLGSSTHKYKFSIASISPVNEKHLATKEELELINQFINTNASEIVNIDKKKSSLLVVRPVYMDEKLGCTECHSEETNGSSFGRLRGVFMVESDMKPIQKQVNATIFQNSLAGFFILIISIVLAIIISTSFTKPIIELRTITENLAIGDLNQEFKYESKDEIGFIAQSFNKMINSLKKIGEFSNEIGKGNYSHDFQMLSDNDIIGKSLLNMRDSLVKAQKNELDRKDKDEKERWKTQGLAKFSDILRTNSTNIKELSFNIMSNIVNYLDVNQGALFIVDDSDENQVIFELKCAIAYGRDKYLKKRVGIGEELVGRCAFEKKTIYMTDIPNDYIQITSGMGTANPRALLLVPLILNEEVYGVIELASFHPFEKHMIEFVEKLGESIASTIASVKVNERTSKLLQQSKSQAEELAAQEEEMRQNLEELQATQEESERREFEMAGIIKALGSTAFMVEYDLDGNILSCNSKYAEILGIPQEQIIGQKHSQGFEFTPEMKANYNLFWGELRRGIQKRETNRIVLNGNEFWVDETYTPITGLHDDKPYKILKIGFNITDQKLKEQQMIGQEIKIKKEKLLLSEYQARLVELQTQIAELKKKKEEPIVEKIEPVIVKPIVSEVVTNVSETNYLDWTSSFETNISEMDEQHKQLVSLANQMGTAINSDKNKKEIKETIRSFVDFAAYHFGNEEKYFEKLNFSLAKEHEAEHKLFIKTISQFQADFAANKLKSTDESLNYIKNWLFHHFSEVDKKYVELFKASGM